MTHSPEALRAPLPVGTRVRKIKGSSWQGHVVGTYSTTTTPEGYCIESERELGSVQIYPRSALEVVTDPAASSADGAPPASASSGSGQDKYSPRWYAELIVDNAECGAQLEIQDEVLRESLIINAEKQVGNAVERAFAAGERSEREAVAAWMMKQGFATGRGDTTADLLAEMEWQIAERVSRSERSGIEKAAKVADAYSEGPLYAPELGGSHPRDNARLDASHDIARRVRSLTPKGPEIDPNAWAFKNGLEST